VGCFRQDAKHAKEAQRREVSSIAKVQKAPRGHKEEEGVLTAKVQGRQEAQENIICSAIF
jgi:hypothetical protein